MKQPSRKQTMTGGILLFLLIAGAYVVGFVGWASPRAGAGNTSSISGQWTSMPFNSTELFNETTHRVILDSFDQIAGIGLALEVSCTIPSNTVGANLQMQSATYSSVTGLNTTNFTNLATSLLIDNSTNHPCPGTLITGTTFPAAATQAGVVNLILRVVGSGGGGTGDNPVFTAINLMLRHKIFNLVDTYASSKSTTGFTASVTFTLTPQAATTISFDWMAQGNTTLTTGLVQSGTDSCTVNLGLFSCTKAVTFPVAFLSTPNVVISPRTVGTILQMPLGYRSFFITR